MERWRALERAVQFLMSRLMSRRGSYVLDVRWHSRHFTTGGRGADENVYNKVQICCPINPSKSRYINVLNYT